MLTAPLFKCAFRNEIHRDKQTVSTIDDEIVDYAVSLCNTGRCVSDPPLQLLQTFHLQKPG